MSWQDAPPIDAAQPSWMNAPPITPQPATEQRPDLGMNTAISGGPVVDRAAALMQTYAPEALGGTGMDYDTNLQANQEETEAARQKHPWAAATGDLAGILPYLAVPEASLARGLTLGQKVAAGAATAGPIGFAQGAANAPDWSNIKETLKEGATGGLAGEGLGALFPLAGAAVGKIGKLFKPSPERQAMLDTLERSDVPVTGGQAMGSPFISGLEKEGSGGKKAATGQMQDFTGALMKEGGIPTANATQQSLEGAGKEIGDKFSSLSSRNTLVPDEQLGKDIHEAAGTYNKLVSPSEEVSKVADRLSSRSAQPISGADYQDMRSELTKKAYAARTTNPAEADSYRGMRDALDSGMERSIAANNPGDAETWGEARRAYGNFQDISKAASKTTGENAVSGVIPPSRMQAVLSSGGRAPGYAAGKGDLAGLTRAGVGVLGAPAQTGNSPLANMLLSHALRAGVGGSIGGYEGGWQGALTGAAIGEGLPRAAGTAVRSPLAQALLKKLAAPSAPSQGPPRKALAATLGLNAYRQNRQLPSTTPQ